MEKLHSALQRQLLTCLRLAGWKHDDSRNFGDTLLKDGILESENVAL